MNDFATIAKNLRAQGGAPRRSVSDTAAVPMTGYRFDSEQSRPGLHVFVNPQSKGDVRDRKLEVRSGVMVYADSGELVPPNPGVKARIDALGPLSEIGYRKDAQETYFVAQLVTETIREFFRHKYVPAKWVNGELISIDSSIDEGADVFTWHELGSTGEAAFIDQLAGDVPMVDLHGITNEQRVYPYGAGFQYTTKDLRKAKLQGAFDLVAEKSRVARDAMDRKLNAAIERGQTGLLLTGVTGLSNTTTDSCTEAWATASSVEMFEDVSGAIRKVRTETKGLYEANTVLMPLAQWGIAESTLMDATNSSNETVLELLKKKHPQITKWDWVPGLDTAASGSNPMIMIYNRDRDVVRAVRPMADKVMPPQQRDFAYRVVMEATFGGVICPVPKAVCYLTGC